MRGAQLRQEVLHDHLLHVAVTGMRCGDRFEPGELVGPAVTDADEDAGGERDAQLAGGFERGEATLGGLVGSVAVRFEVGVDRLDHHPLARAERADLGQFVEVQRAGVGVRQADRSLAAPAPPSPRRSATVES